MGYAHPGSSAFSLCPALDSGFQSLTRPTEAVGPEGSDREARLPAPPCLGGPPLDPSQPRPKRRAALSKPPPPCVTFRPTAVFSLHLRNASCVVVCAACLVLALLLCSGAPSPPHLGELTPCRAECALAPRSPGAQFPIAAPALAWHLGVRALPICEVALSTAACSALPWMLRTGPRS